MNNGQIIAWFILGFFAGMTPMVLLLHLAMSKALHWKKEAWKWENKATGELGDWEDFND